MQEYLNLSDEQLIEKLNEGDVRLMDYILDKYKPLVRRRANAMFLIGGDTDDLIQEGMIGLFKAIRDYDSKKETSFFSFAELCITRQIYSAVKASTRKKHAPLNTYISFDAKTGEEGKPLVEILTTEDVGNPEQLVIAKENRRLFWKDLKGKLSNMERRVLGEYLLGLSYQQIAEKFGKSPKAIDNALQRIKAKIR